MQSASFRPLRGRFQKLFEVRATDPNRAAISLKWFRVFKGFETKFTPGATLIATGAVKTVGALREMIHPEIHFDLEDQTHVGRIIPIYTEIEGVPSKTIRTLIDFVMTQFGNQLSDDLPLPLLNHFQFPRIAQAIQSVDFPAKLAPGSATAQFSGFRSAAHARLIFEEFFKFEYHVLSRRISGFKKEPGHPLNLMRLTEDRVQYEQQLPFTLTAGQRQALDQIFSDLSQPYPMNRLLQGDVGAGKTAVALIAALSTLKQKYSVALMAPTEILAEQHFQNTLRIFGADTPARLLVKTSTNERREIQARLDSDQAVLLIGTHALIESPVKFSNLGLVIIDEQHRFGVEQRKKLREKERDCTPSSTDDSHTHSTNIGTDGLRRSFGFDYSRAPSGPNPFKQSWSTHPKLNG